MLWARRRWAWAPVWHMPIRRSHRRTPAATAHHPRALRAAVTRARRRHTAQVDLAGLRTTAPAEADPAVLRTTAPADPAGLAGLAVLRTTDLVDPAGLRTAARVVLLPVLRADGTGMTTAATSTGNLGATDPHPGAGVSRPARTGADRSRRPDRHGSVARSTTGVTRKHPCGIPGSTSGASGSSGSGSRCKEPAVSRPVDTAAALPGGEAAAVPRAVAMAAGSF